MQELPPADQRDLSPQGLAWRRRQRVEVVVNELLFLVSGGGVFHFWLTANDSEDVGGESTAAALAAAA